jgi:hypothetical protein
MTTDYDVMAMMAEEADRFDSQSEDSNKAFLDKFVVMPQGEGFVVARVLPPLPGKKIYTATRTHRLVKDPKNKKGGRNLHCPRELITNKQGKKMWVDTDPKKPCPVCMWARVIWAKVEAAGGKETPEGKVWHAEYSRIKAIERFYYNCGQRFYNKKGEFEKNSDTAKILSVGQGLHERIVRAFVGDPKAGPKGKKLGNIADLAEGRDFTIVKKFRADSDYPQYDDSGFGDPSPAASPEEIEVWLATRHDLEALRVVKPWEDIDIALQKYTGALPDEEVQFDTTKYAPKALGEQVAEALKPSKATVSAPVSVPSAPKVEVKSDDRELAEGDFLDGIDAELSKMP